MTKITKEKAGYREPPAGLFKVCRNCTMFRAPDGCTLVKGKIDPKAVCRYWERKK